MCASLAFRLRSTVPGVVTGASLAFTLKSTGSNCTGGPQAWNKKEYTNIILLSGRLFWLLYEGTHLIKKIQPEVAE